MSKIVQLLEQNHYKSRKVKTIHGEIIAVKLTYLKILNTITN